MKVPKVTNETSTYGAAVKDTGYMSICPHCGLRYNENKSMINRERYLDLKPCCKEHNTRLN